MLEHFNFLFSLGIHIAILVLLIFWSNHKLSERADLAKNVEIEINSFSSSLQLDEPQRVKPHPKKGLANQREALSDKKVPERIDKKVPSEITEGLSSIDVFRNLSVKTSIEAYPFLFDLYRRIDQELWYPEVIGESDHDGDIAIDFDIDQTGQILMPARNVVARDEVLKGLVLKTLAETAQRHDRHLYKTRFKKMTLRANFHFQIRKSEKFGKIQDPPVVKNILSFYRYHETPSPLTFHLDPSSVDRKGKAAFAGVLQIELVQLWNALFGKKKLKSMERMKWDIEFKRKEFREACEDLHYEGACEQLGFIEKILGNFEGSVRHYAMACSMGLSAACSKSASN